MKQTKHEIINHLENAVIWLKTHQKDDINIFPSLIRDIENANNFIKGE